MVASSGSDRYRHKPHPGLNLHIASSSTSSKLPGLDGLGGLFGNSGDSNLNGGDNLNHRQQPFWQPPNAPGMNAQQGNTNGVGVNTNNDQPSWW